MDYSKLYGEDQKPPEKPVKAPLPPSPVELTQATITEYCQSLKPELMNVLREIASDPEQPAAARLTAAKELLDRGFGKTTSDAPALVEKADKSDVASKVLSLLTDAQLQELRADE